MKEHHFNQSVFLVSERLASISKLRGATVTAAVHLLSIKYNVLVFAGCGLHTQRRDMPRTVMYASPPHMFSFLHYSINFKLSSTLVQNVWNVQNEVFTTLLFSAANSLNYCVSLLLEQKLQTKTIKWRYL